jgi:hypothetical protein
VDFGGFCQPKNRTVYLPLDGGGRCPVELLISGSGVRVSDGPPPKAKKELPFSEAKSDMMFAQCSDCPRTSEFVENLDLRKEGIGHRCSCPDSSVGAKVNEVSWYFNEVIGLRNSWRVSLPCPWWQSACSCGPDIFVEAFSARSQIC